MGGSGRDGFGSSGGGYGFGSSGGGYSPTYSIDNKVLTQQCCLDEGVYQLICEDVYGDGWHGGKLEIDGEPVCEVEGSEIKRDYTIGGVVASDSATTTCGEIRLTSKRGRLATSENAKAATCARRCCKRADMSFRQLLN